MKMLQEMKNLLIYGLILVSLEKEFLIFQKVKIGGDQLEKQDLVDQIVKYFIGYEKENSHQQEVM
jgi:hypothetical protein